MFKKYHSSVNDNEAHVMIANEVFNLQPGIIPIKPMPLPEIRRILGSDVKDLELNINTATIEDIAWDLAAKARHKKSRRKQIELAIKALKLDANCSNAWLLLSEESSNAEEAIALCRNAVKGAEASLGPDFMERFKPDYWHSWPTRFYMNALEELATRLAENDQFEEAIQYYYKLLDMNPLDNGDIRGLIVPCLIQHSRDAEAVKILCKYRESTAEILYSHLLIRYRACGDSPKTRKVFKAAFAENPFVVPFLVGAVKLPKEEPVFYQFGNEEEAVIYVNRGMRSWKASPGAIEWLTSNCADIMDQLVEKMSRK
ncbi:MAG TPA: hypothetical protein VHV83_21555 [Armatimonadota bacterium]|nr:hypothetical protein [Armatimonadota bacterium]